MTPIPHADGIENGRMPAKRKALPTRGGGVPVPPSHRPNPELEEKKMAAKLEIVRAEYQGFAVFFKEDAWFNATVAAEHYGKRPNDWLNLESTKEYLNALASMLQCEPESLCKTKRGGNTRNPGNGGTWIHPNLVVAFARWLTPDFAVWCDLQIHQILKGTHPHYDWKRLRHESKASNKAMNGIVQMILEEQGKAMEAYRFSNEARLVNWALTGEFKGLDRDTLSLEQLDILAKLEEKNSVLLGRGVKYETRKLMLEQYAIDRHVPERKAINQ